MKTTTETTTQTTGETTATKAERHPVNQVKLSGFLGKDALLSDVGKTKVCKFSLATNNNYKNSAGEEVQETQWHNIIMWGKVAEAAATLKKGNKIEMTGTIKYSNYTNKDGVKIYVTEITAFEFAKVTGSTN